MADATRIIEFLFVGDDKTGPAITSISSGLESLNSGVADMAQPFADVTEALLKFETAVIAIGVAVAAFAVNEAGKFDASMRELATLINGGEQQAGEFSAALQKMGQDSIASLEDLTGAMYKAVSQTGSLEEASLGVAAAEKLAVAGRADLTDTTLVLLGALASYGQGMDEAAHFSDVFFATVQTGQTTLPELAASFGQVAPIAAAMGVSIEELGGAIALLTKSGIGTSEAITGIKAALNNIAQPSKDAEATAKSLGIQFDSAGLASKGFAAFMADVATKTGGSQQALSDLFGSIEGRNAVFVLAKERGDAFAAAVDAIAQASGNTQAAYELMADTFTARNQQIENNLKLVGIAFGTGLLEPVGRVQDSISALLQSIADAITAGAFDELLSAGGSALDALAANIEKIADIFPEVAAGLDFTALLDALRDLTGEVGGIFDGIDLTTPEGLTRILQTLIDTAESMIRVTTGITEVLGPLINQFGEWALAGNELSPATKELIGNILGIGTAISAATALLAPFLVAFSGLTTVLPLVGTALQVVAGGFGLLTVGGAVVSGVSSLTDTFYEVARSMGYVGTQTEILALQQERQAAQLAAQNTQWQLLDGTVSLIGGTFYDAAAAQEAQIESTRAQEQANAAAVTQWKVLDDTVSLIGGTFQDAADAATKAADDQQSATQVTASALDDLMGAWRETGGIIRDTSLSMDLAKKGFYETDQAVRTAADGTQEFSGVMTLAGNTAKDAGDKAAGSLSKTAEEALKAQQETNKFAVEWEKIASQERQVIFEVSAAVAIAQIEAGTERVKAAFESINVTIESTGTTLTGLAGALASVGTSSGAGRAILDLMEEENRRRQEALDLQKRLVESQVAYLDAVVARMTQGEALITVTADGLEPELEAFMFKILERVQVKASSEAQQFLLGLQQ